MEVHHPGTEAQATGCVQVKANEKESIQAVRGMMHVMSLAKGNWSRPSDYAITSNRLKYYINNTLKIDTNDESI